MYDPLFNPARGIRNKADALQYAINATMQHKCGEGSKVDYEEAKKLFDFITENVALPDVAKDSYSEMMGALTGLITANETCAE